ncbi:Homocysteine S-methyltransferase [Suillus paluster]|uniref:Homocysteine S-methyltransferase n=1 Tax=Suillus paluster TaxID=48578 RepID=UPI001B880347|nr:Homocysteine S-methyltransferase [Suillus paluster]KAG1751331.1 Homocysteine S-methyltransferase [Suillus paluster]
MTTLRLSDGGLGSTLQDHFHLPTPFSSGCIAPNALRHTHHDFLEAGSRVLLTSTGQAACEHFQMSSEVMRLAVDRANQARDQFCNATEDSPTDIHIALVLAPFGRAPNQDSEGNTISFGDDIESKNNSTEALTRSHEDRLREIASDKEIWNRVDFVAFESVQLVGEVKAIRQAMGNLKEIINPKPWWITATFPRGKFPQPGGGFLPAGEVANTIICNDNNMPVPDGIGINGTALEFLPGLLQDVERVIGGNTRPRLVLHPHGARFNSLTSDQWANELAGLINKAKGRGWNNIIVGGCCKTGPIEINALREAI